MVLGAEFWIEEDSEVDEDITLEDAVIPPSSVPVEPVQQSVEVNTTIRWIVALSVFQTQFNLTNRALSWLLMFFSVIFKFLGKYSAELALQFPRTVHHYQLSLSGIVSVTSFERRAVCIKCDTMYKFEQCIVKVGTQTTSALCKCKHFRKICNQILMK